MYVFYKKIDDNTGKVEAVYQASELTAEQKELGIEVASVPATGSKQALYINLTTHELTVGADIQEDTIADLKHRLNAAENKIQNGHEAYEKLDVNTVSLAELKAGKSAQLKHFCDLGIASGFRSSSTGYLMGFTESDQKNITNQVIVFLANPNAVDCQWKTEDQGVKLLTKAQFMNLLPEGEGHMRANVGKLWMLNSQVNAATTKEAVTAINW